MKKKENILYTIVIIIILITIVIYRNNLKQKNKELTGKGIVAVGKIIDVGFPGNVSTSGYSFNYIYYVDNTKYEGGSLSDEKYPEGSYFEVIYLPYAPEESRMEFSKPVHPDSVCTYFNEECPFEKEINND